MKPACCARVVDRVTGELRPCGLFGKPVFCAKHVPGAARREALRAVRAGGSVRRPFGRTA